MAYNSFSSSLKALGMLVSSVLLKSLIHADFSQQALLNRGYRGQMKFHETHESFKLKQIFIPVFLMICLLAIGQMRL